MIFFHITEPSVPIIRARTPWLTSCLDAVGSIDFSAGNQRVADGIDVKTVAYETAAPSPCIFETHRNHIDVQVCLEGEERILLSRSSTLQESTEWDEKGDVIFYHNPEGPTDSLTMRSGSVLVLFPEDAHRCGERVGEGDGRLRKLVFKVHRDLWPV